MIPGDSAAFEEGIDADEIGFTYRQERLLKLSAMINLESNSSVGCVGAVLTYLQRKTAAERDFIQDDVDAQWAYRVRHIEAFSVEGTM